MMYPLAMDWDVGALTCVTNAFCVLQVEKAESLGTNYSFYWPDAFLCDLYINTSYSLLFYNFG